MEAAARRVLDRACFSEIRTPTFERTELFERSVGEATEVVEKQMYTFESRSGKDRITLRPENTAGVVRAFLQHGLRTKSPMPLKLWYLGPMFRYERPQRGRQRQFHQLGVETIGSADPRADAEVILVACEFLRECGLDDLVVDLNSIGDPADRARYREALVEYLTSVKDRLDEAAKLLEQHDSVDSIELNNGALAVTLREDIDDYSHLPSVLVESGFQLTLFREEEVNLESAFMALTKGTGAKI